MVYFKIKINPNNLANKADISKYSRFKYEEEVLLYPYFSFKVISNYPRRIKINNTITTVCKIKIEETNTRIFNYNIIWFDPEVNNNQNKLVQQQIRSICGNILVVFEDASKAANYFKLNEQNFRTFNFVISCGSRGKEFLDAVHDNDYILQFYLFVGNVEKHKKWADKQIYHKLHGVYDCIYEFLGDLPNENFYY